MSVKLNLIYRVGQLGEYFGSFISKDFEEVRVILVFYKYII
jgi:hypothetical protein